ncbi:hypothetical protein IMSAGC017_02380 [Thomasclavelia cocleata]|uniref:Accessory gene regulator B n=1 Tax=Thomasclavelia cocleata TaxID=69824 RepID=A0A829ZED3_9FIRM|nr:accessory gene regulator B family protein [Thomasclavelia cocleata]GFI42332.1 hypothetical protein IMSAGC017_02380 [Thomasclavelia cocleata]
MLDFDSYFRKFTFYLANWIVSNNEAYKKDLEVVGYGLCALLTSILNLSISGVTTYFFNILENYVIFLCFFVPIRCTHKGFHCKKLLHCLAITNICFTSATFICSRNANTFNEPFVFFLVLFLHYYFSYERNEIIHTIIFLTYFIIYIIAPKLGIYLIISLTLNLILIGGGKLNDAVSTKKLL